MKEMREAKLFPPLKDHLKKRGYKVYGEIPCLGTNIDVVAVLPAYPRMEAVVKSFELKTGFTKKVLYQARMNTSFVHFSYAVSSTTPRTDFMEWCERLGIGVWKIVDGKVQELHPAKLQTPIKSSPLLRMELFTNRDEAEIAGLPTNKGNGPAQDVFRRIKKYLENHPTADWKEIYANVPNHYSSHGSMRGSMKSWYGFSLR